MENRKRERIIEAGMALLLVITLTAAGQSGKIPVVKSQEIQVQADSGKRTKVKKKEIRRIQIRRQRVQRKIPGIPGKMKVDLIWKALQWLLLLPNIPLWEKAMYPYRKWSIILTDQDELIRLQHWQQEGGFYRDILRLL